MCGRYALFSAAAAIEEVLDLARFRKTSGFLSTDQNRANYNIAPGTLIRVIRLDASGTLKSESMLWGLVPTWKKGTSRSLLFNARAETVGEKPSFRHAFVRRRCVIPADGFFEWLTPTQPHYISRTDKQPMAFAGIWEQAEITVAQHHRCAIITTPAQGVVKSIHHRMPALIGAEDVALWLNPKSSIALLEGVLRTSHAHVCSVHPVDPRVNVVDHNEATMIQAHHAKTQKQLSLF